MHRRNFLSLSVSGLIGLFVPRSMFARHPSPVHLVYEIGVRKGTFGRGCITGHLQLDLDATRYRISLWAEEIRKKLLFITVGHETEEDTMDLVLDPEHVNPLRIRYVAYGRVGDSGLVSDGVVVIDKVDGAEISHLRIDDAINGGALATYRFLDTNATPRLYRTRPSDPLTALISLCGGKTSVLTTSLTSVDSQFVLGERLLTAVARDGTGYRLNTGPDDRGRFWDFKTDTSMEVRGDRIQRLRVDAYNKFRAIEATCKGTEAMMDIGIDHVAEYAAR